MKTLTIGAALVVFAACSSSAQQTHRPAQNDVVATVGSAAITLAEVDDKALEQQAGSFGGVKLSQALYEARRLALDDIVATKLLDGAAKAEGIDRPALVEKEITAKIQPVTEPEIAAWYRANQARVQGASLDQARQPIRAFLVQVRMQDVRAKYLDELRSKTSVRVMLDPPRQAVAAANSPAKGPARAPVELIEFSDFQCRTACAPTRPSSRCSAPTAIASGSSTVTIPCPTIRTPARPPRRPPARASRTGSGSTTTGCLRTPRSSATPI